MAEALQRQVGAAETARLFRAADLEPYLLSPPQAMVDEGEVVRLHKAVRDALDAGSARAIFREAGLRTADYLLKNRIPGFAQTLLHALPAALASRALTTAIRRHAWTFCGSGRFAVQPGNPTWLIVSDCVICRETEADTAICDYYAACFERLFRRLVSPLASVCETECQASGATACCFRVSW